MSVEVLQEHDLLVETVRDYARARLVDQDRRWDAEELSCCEQLDELYDLGLMSLRVPEHCGGLAVPMVTYADLIRELAAASAAVAVTVAVHNMVAEAIRMFAPDSVRDSVLESLARPGNLAAFAISEPNAGSDPGSARTRAERTADGWKLSGAKMWVTNGLTGRWFIVLARTAASASDRELSMFLLDAQQAKVTRTPIHGKMGIRGSETAEMHLDGAYVPAEHMLGQRGDGLKVALSALDGGRIGIASQAVGIATAALEQMIAYSRQREQFGQTISSYQAIQWMLADSQTECMAAQQLIHRAAWLKDQGLAFTREASMAKLYASEAANRVVYRAVQVHGGYGFVREFRVEQLYRDARITTLYEGTSEVQRIVIARGLLQG